MDRVRKYMAKSPMLMFWQGRKRVYLVSGRKNVQSVFAKWKNVNNEKIMLGMNLPTWYRLTKQDLAKWALDRSGRGRNPMPGSENRPHHQRYFYGYEHVHTEYLSKPQWLNPLVEKYQEIFQKRIDTYDYRDWTELSVLKWWRNDVTECAVEALLGPKVLQIRPDFCDLFWQFDEHTFSLAIGFPKWLYSTPYKVQKEYLETIQAYLDAAYKEFDYNDPAALEAPWEPHFGAQVSRQVITWFKECGFNAKDTAAGALGILVWAENSNVIPIGEWMIMEIARDKALLLALREEVKSAYDVDPVTGRRTLDLKKFGALPLLSSVYHESLRMSMSFNMVRDVAEEFELNNYKIKKGSWIQVPTLVAHYDEDAWGAPGHPATEFWAERNIKYVEEKDDLGNISRKRVFDMSGRSGSYFPYGGGNLICPGRQFAKHEMTLTVGLLLEKYDFEFSSWVKFDGTPSDRGAKHYWHYCGSGSAPPDRDMTIRIRRAQDS